MHSVRRFLAGLLVLVISLAVPWTLSPGAVVLAVMWSLAGVALLGLLLTWEPVAQRLPYRVVRNVTAPELPPGAAKADAALADECERVADEIDAWVIGAEAETRPSPSGIIRLPADWSARFDGPVFRVLEQLVARRYITRDDLRRVATGNLYLTDAKYCSRYVREWAHRLRRD